MRDAFKREIKEGDTLVYAVKTVDHRLALRKIKVIETFDDRVRGYDPDDVVQYTRTIRSSNTCVVMEIQY